MNEGIILPYEAATGAHEIVKLSMRGRVFNLPIHLKKCSNEIFFVASPGYQYCHRRISN
jgi:hypothetical protein